MSDAGSPNYKNEVSIIPPTLSSSFLSSDDDDEDEDAVAQSFVLCAAAQQLLQSQRNAGASDTEQKNTSPVKDASVEPDEHGMSPVKMNVPSADAAIAALQQRSRSPEKSVLDQSMDSMLDTSIPSMDDVEIEAVVKIELCDEEQVSVNVAIKPATATEPIAKQIEGSAAEDMTHASEEAILVAYNAVEQEASENEVPPPAEPSTPTTPEHPHPDEHVIEHGYESTAELRSAIVMPSDVLAEYSDSDSLLSPKSARKAAEAQAEADAEAAYELDEQDNDEEEAKIIHNMVDQIDATCDEQEDENDIDEQSTEILQRQPGELTSSICTNPSCIELIDLTENLTLEVSELQERYNRLQEEGARLFKQYEIKCAMVKATKKHNAEQASYISKTTVEHEHLRREYEELYLAYQELENIYNQQMEVLKEIQREKEEEEIQAQLQKEQEEAERLNKQENEEDGGQQEEIASTTSSSPTETEIRLTSENEKLLVQIEHLQHLLSERSSEHEKQLDMAREIGRQSGREEALQGIQNLKIRNLEETQSIMHQLEEAQDTLSKSQRQVKEFEEEIARLRTENVEAFENFQRSTLDTTQKHQAEIAQLNCEWATKIEQTRMEAIQTIQTDSDTRIAQIQDAKEIEIEQAHSLVSSLRYQVADAEARLKTQEEALRASTRSMEDLHKEIATLKAELDTTKTTLSSNVAQLVASQAVSEALRADTKCIPSLKQQLAEALEELNAAISAKKASEDAAETSRKLSEESREKLQVDLETSRKRLEASIEEWRTRYETETDAANKQMEALRTELSSMQEQLATLSSKYASLVSEHASLQTELSQIPTLCSQIDSLTSKLVEGAKEKAHLQQLLKSVEDQLSEVVRQHQFDLKCSAQITQEFEEELQATKNAQEALRGKYRESKRKVEELKEKVEQMETALEEAHAKLDQQAAHASTSDAANNGGGTSSDLSSVSMSMPTVLALKSQQLSDAQAEVDRLSECLLRARSENALLEGRVNALNNLLVSQQQAENNPNQRRMETLEKELENLKANAVNNVNIEKERQMNEQMREEITALKRSVDELANDKEQLIQQVELLTTLQEQQQQQQNNSSADSTSASTIASLTSQVSTLEGTISELKAYMHKYKASGEAKMAHQTAEHQRLAHHVAQVVRRMIEKGWIKKEQDLELYQHVQTIAHIIKNVSKAQQQQQQQQQQKMA